MGDTLVANQGCRARLAALACQGTLGSRVQCLEAGDLPEKLVMPSRHGPVLQHQAPLRGWP